MAGEVDFYIKFSTFQDCIICSPMIMWLSWASNFLSNDGIANSINIIEIFKKCPGALNAQSLKHSKGRLWRPRALHWALFWLKWKINIEFHQSHATFTNKRRDYQAAVCTVIITVSSEFLNLNLQMDRGREGGFRQKEKHLRRPIFFN